MGRKYLSKQLRAWVQERAQNRCEYCLSPARYATQSFSIDHIIPVSQNGTSTEENLALSCEGCNTRKAVATEAFDPETQTMVPLYHPRYDDWATHFEWNELRNIEVVGLTPIGRATIQRLQLNRITVCNLRQLLILIGEHPP